MSLLAWNDMFRVGVLEIDNQHKQLIEITNRLNQAMAEDRDRWFDQGEVDLTGELMALLRDWLTKHILNSDRALGKALNLRGVH